MSRVLRMGVVAAALLGALSGCTNLYFKDAGVEPAPAPQYTLENWPYSEYWTGIIFSGEKVGYAHVVVAPSAEAPGSYEIRAQGLMHFRLLGFDKRIALESVDRVGPDLTLEAFSHRYDLDGSRLEVDGRVENGTLTGTVANAGRTSKLALDLDGPVYPASVGSMIPVHRGLRVGAEHRYAVFSAQAQKIAPVVQKVEAYEKSEFFEELAYRVTTGFLGLTSTTWLSDRGLPLLELVLGGVIISAISTEERAKGFIATTAVNKDEAIINFSLVRPEGTIDDPRSLRRLDVLLAGNPSLAVVPSDARQQCRREGEALRCEIQAVPKWSAAMDDATLRKDLHDSLAVPWGDQRISSLAHAIAAGRTDVEGRIAALRAWIRQNVRQQAVDPVSALDVLRTGAAECQGHAFLYAAFARALGIPTRVVNGVVYSSQHGGFLYHTWNESWIGDGWVAVDTTFDQLPADATHIKLVYGESAGDLIPLAGWIGKMRIRVLDSGS